MEDERYLARKAYITAIGLEQKELQLKELNTHEPLSQSDFMVQQRLTDEIRELQQQFAEATDRLYLPEKSTFATA